MKDLLVFADRLKKLISLPWEDKLLLAEAFILMGASRLAILVIPFNKLACFMGKHKEESPVYMNERDKYTSLKIKWAITLAGSHISWKSRCLVQALAAQAMLNRRKIHNTLYLGVAKDSKNQLMAHAWLRSGEYIITGGFERRWFTTVTYFSNNAGGCKQ